MLKLIFSHIYMHAYSLNPCRNCAFIATLIYNFKMKKKKSVASNVIIGLILNNNLFNVFISAFKLKTVTHIKCTLSV